ncbi:MAG: DNA polymerase III subunit delta [Bacteroidetes bacterium]|uniref:DNA polymerase III subunit delta n=1 Tax=Phaeocystidibacter marisrubri TaxID=1577780 RepID=A0A6L3ZHQ9_9FLAO|nr:DNA polymerase III subunit delta [Phaeocystidibacter marisrubri]KAB2817159.1 DNA polymerase III subunit delta [Phaeocystidibacter marisrubri]TNE28755.1 MAG: DNA polymerase III subunit delta [Bacteroidota bacterium]GGH76618.1 DNA polymerase III subunit delta [Phaeocystidibacter marisrubri]
MTFEAIQSELNKKIYRPIYFLMGEEPYFIDAIVDRIEEEVLDESERGFNQSVLYGKDVSAQDIISEAKRFPMMSDKQVVVVKEAQHIRNIEDLKSYAEQPQPSTVLVIAYKYKKLDKRKALAKVLAKSHVLFESKKLYDNQVADWVSNMIREGGYKVSPKAVALLTEFVGSDLGRMNQEIEKLMLVVPKGGEISADVIERNIGISKDYNNFELQKALGEGDILKANKIVHYFAQNPKDNPLVVTISLVFSFFTKVMIVHSHPGKSPQEIAGALRVNPYFAKDYLQAAKRYNMNKCLRIVGYIREADGRSKGLGGGDISHEDILRELLFKILH